MNLLLCLAFCVSVSVATWVKPAGWLDRLVQYHKEKFLNEVYELAPVKIKATVTVKQPTYVDSSDWDFKSVIRLINLIRQSEDAKPARVALRRMLRPSRRFINKALSYKLFPSLIKDAKNEFYYDLDSDEMYIEEDQGTTNNTYEMDPDEAIIIISNPVESRLPSSQISVRLLTQILENRAKAGRQMPSTTRFTITTKSKKTTEPMAATEESHTTPKSDAAESETTLLPTTTAAAP